MRQQIEFAKAENRMKTEKPVLQTWHLRQPRKRSRCGNITADHNYKAGTVARQHLVSRVKSEASQYYVVCSHCNPPPQKKTHTESTFPHFS
jgi:hypothetical protein